MTVFAKEFLYSLMRNSRGCCQGNEDRLALFGHMDSLW